MISKQVKVKYKANKTGEGVEIGYAASVPDLGQGTSEKIDVTPLNSDTRVYEEGIKDLGDNLAFEIFYDRDEFESLTTAVCNGKQHTFIVEYPDGVTNEIDGSATYTNLGFSVGEAIKYRLDVTPGSAVRTTFPSSTK